MLQAAAQLGLKFTPEIVSGIKSAIGLLGSKDPGQLVDVLKEGAEAVVSASVSDSGVSSSIHTARKSLLSSLEPFHRALGEAHPELREIIGLLRSPEVDLTDELKSQLKELLEKAIEGVTTEELHAETSSPVGKTSKPVGFADIYDSIDSLRGDKCNPETRQKLLAVIKAGIDGKRIDLDEITQYIHEHGGAIPELEISHAEIEQPAYVDESAGGGIAEQPNPVKQFTAEDIERARKEGFSEGQKTSTVHEHREKPTDPMAKVLYSVGEIFRGEVENGSSELGMLAKMCAWWTGVKLDKNSIKGYVNGFAQGETGKKLEGLIEAKFKGQEYSLDGMKTHEKALVQVAGTLVTLGSKVPPSWMDAFAKFGLALDWGAEILQRIPFGGFILRIPGVRKLLTGSAQFVGRFREPLEDIYNGVQGLKSKYVPSPEPAVVSVGGK